MQPEMDALLERLADMVAERVVARVTPTIGEEVRRELEAVEGDRLLDSTALAELLGVSPEALRKRLSRGSELAELAFTVDGKRMWRKSEVLALLRKKKPPRLRAVKGGRRD